MFTTIPDPKKGTGSTCVNSMGAGKRSRHLAVTDGGDGVSNFGQQTDAKQDPTPNPTHFVPAYREPTYSSGVSAGFVPMPMNDCQEE